MWDLRRWMNDFGRWNKYLMKGGQGKSTKANQNWAKKAYGRKKKARRRK